MKFKVEFPFSVRQAMNVAYAVAEELRGGRRPQLLSIGGGVIPTFRFEGGVVAKVHMVDLDTYTESWRTPHLQDWVVTHCEVRYYPEGGGGGKVTEVWGAERLLELKSSRPWWHPHVKDVRDIKGIVGVFVDTAAGEGYISVDPERNQEGHFTLLDEVKYARFVEGDLERARKEAKEVLRDLLVNNVVAVFYNAVTGEARKEDSPTRNYRGSGCYPFSFWGEYEYNPQDPGNKAAALAAAEAEVCRLRGGAR